MPLDPLSLRLQRSFIRKTISIYPKSAPVLSALFTQLFHLRWSVNSLLTKTQKVRLFWVLELQDRVTAVGRHWEDAEKGVVRINQQVRASHVPCLEYLLNLEKVVFFWFHYKWQLKKDSFARTYRGSSPKHGLISFDSQSGVTWPPFWKPLWQAVLSLSIRFQSTRRF